MFSPLPMKHVLLQVMTEDLPQVSLTLAELEAFSPDYRPLHDEHFPTIPGQRFRDIYNQACSRLEKISKHVSLASQIRLKSIHVITERELEKTNNWLGKVWARCSAFEETFHRLTDEEHMIQQLEEALDNFSDLNLDLSLLQGEKLFLDVRVGIIPRANVTQLKEAVGLAGYLLFTYMEHGENSHVIVVGPRGEREEELGSVLDTAGFNPLPIPPELHAEPVKVRSELQTRRQRLSDERRKESDGMASCADELRGELEQARGVLVMAEPFVRIDTAARSSGHLSIISGWIPSREIRRTKKALAQRLKNPFHIDSRSPTAEERPLVPSYMPKNWLMAPFATLVKQYGIPRYGEVDPTFIFAISFIVMFGMMFGDVGHGLTIMVVGWLARSKLAERHSVFAGHAQVCRHVVNVGARAIQFSTRNVGDNGRTLETRVKFHKVGVTRVTKQVQPKCSAVAKT